MSLPARRDTESPAVTEEVRALIESHPRWPLTATIAVVVLLGGLVAWLLPALVG